MKNSLKGRLKSRFFIYFLVVSITLGFVFSIPYLPVVSGQFVPDQGFYTIVKQVPYNLYSSGTVYARTGVTDPWATLWTGTGLSTQGQVVHPTVTTLGNQRDIGWLQDTTVRLSARSVLWFDTANIPDSVSIASAYLTITSVHTGSAVDAGYNYLCTYGDQSPPITTGDYTRPTCINTTGFDGNSSSRKVSFPVMYVSKTGYTTFQILTWADMYSRDLGTQGTGDRSGTTISSITLTVMYYVTPPQLQGAYPHDQTVSPNPTLTATVKGFGGDIPGYARLYSGASGSWVLQQNLTVEYANTITLSFKETLASVSGTYMWRVACRLIGYPLLWHNYTFSYVVSAQPPDYPWTEIKYKQVNYSDGSLIVIKTHIPATDYNKYPLNWYVWITDNAGLLVPMFKDGNRAPNYGIAGPDAEINAMINFSRNTTIGTWKLHIGHWSAAESYISVNYYTFTVVGKSAYYRIFPQKYPTVIGSPNYFFTTDENVYYSAIGPSKYMFYWVKLVNGSTGLVVRNDNVSTGSGTAVVSSFGRLAAGTYFLRICTTVTGAILNVSKTFTVGVPVTENSYSISMSKTSFKQSENIVFTVSRTKGVLTYVTMVCDPTGEMVFSSFTAEPTDAISFKIIPDLSPLGRYNVYVYDNGGSYTDKNRATAYFDMTEDTTPPGPDDGDDWGSYFTGLSPYVGIAVFGIFLALGFFITLKTHNGIALPTTLFGGLMMTSIPGTPFTVFPLWVMFICGLILVLLLFSMLRR